MKNILYLILLAVTIGFTSTAFNIIDGSDTRKLDNFSIVDVSAGIKLTLVESNTTKIELETKNCDPDDVITEVDGDRLVIKYKKSTWGISNRKTYATLYYKELEGLEASSGAKIKSENEIKTDEMDIEASSGASIYVEINCEELEVDISSGASVHVEGKCEEQEVEVSSGATYKASELASEIADVDASSGGNAKIWVTKDLSAEVSSGGNIKYKGEPSNKNINKSRSGSVSQM